MNDLPQNIAIAGGGIMGILCAYMVQKHLPDATLTLYDPAGFPANNASYIAGGMISPFSELDHMPESYLSAGQTAINIWESISHETGNGFEFSRNGSLLISHDNDRHILERFKSTLPQCDTWGVVNQEAIKTLEPALPDHKFRYGLHINGEGHLHPKKVMQTLVKLIHKKKSEAFDLKYNSSSYDIVIDCTGINTESDNQHLRGVKGETLVVRNAEFKLSRPLRLMHPRYPLYIVPRNDNIFMIGATIIESENSPHMSLRSGMELMSALYSIHPSFGDAEILEMNAGIRPSYDDNLPQIHVRNNIISCNGLYRHGYLFSPIMAQCVIGILTGKPCEYAPLFVRNNTHEDHTKRTAMHA